MISFKEKCIGRARNFCVVEAVISVKLEDFSGLFTVGIVLQASIFST